MDAIRLIPSRSATHVYAICFGCVAAKADAVKAADLLLRDGNFPLVVLDLVLNAADELRKIPQTSWYRLQRLVEPAPTAFLVLMRRSMISSAQTKLVLENNWQLADLRRRQQLLAPPTPRAARARTSQEAPGAADVRDDLRAEFLSAGGVAASAGAARVAGGVDR